MASRKSSAQGQRREVVLDRGRLRCESGFTSLIIGEEADMQTFEVADPAREVLNQPPPLRPLNLFERDLALQEALVREGGAWGNERLREAGEVAGSVEAAEHGRRAEHNLPVLHTHDRYGRRIDEVQLDPSWHWLLRGAIERGIAGLPWREERPGAHVVRA